MKRIPPALLAIAAAVAGCRTQTSTAAETRAAVVSLLEAQQDAWNAGRLDDFLAGYLPSAQLTFISGDQVTRGFAETRARYHRRYGSRAAMGTLAFTDLEVRVLADDAALATGAFTLERAEDRLHGRFTLLLRRVDGAWRIVLDHTSTAE